MADKGEGSRGGKIIRHTKGGYAVYEKSDHDKKPGLIKRIGKSAGYAAAGVGATAAISDVAGRAARKAADVEKRVRDAKALLAEVSKGVAAPGVEASAKKFIVRHSIVQKFLEETHSGGRVAAAAIGAGLLYKSATSAIEGTSYDVQKNKVAAAGAAGIAATVLTRGFEGQHLAHSAKAAWNLAIKKMRKPITR